MGISKTTGIAAVVGTLATLPVALATGEALMRTHEARIAIASARETAEGDTLKILAEAPIPIQPVRLDPLDSSVNNCSGAIINGNLYTAKHCFYTQGGDGELVAKTFEVVSPEGNVIDTIDSNQFAVGKSDFAVRRVTSDVCERAPIVGENAWTVHWIGFEDRPRPAKFTVGEKSELRPDLFTMEGLRPGNDIYKGSSGAAVFATSDGCLIGVLTGLGSKSPILPGGLHTGSITSYYFTAAL